MRRILIRTGYALATFIALIILGLVIMRQITELTPPQPEDQSCLTWERSRDSTGVLTIGSSWLRKNRDGLYEMYVEGDPFERGVIMGKLTRELIREQEGYFVQQIRELISSELYLRFLKYFVSWFNRNLEDHIPPEYLLEMYGISLSASEEFDFIANPYQRIVNYHAAHDIGHALQDLHLVGCTSFAVWDGKSEDSTLIHARNFDFYAGDDFARNKIVAFIRPDQGYPFMMVTWGGMIGAVSGINTKGISVTINAAKSSIPSTAKTPISILTREILQYASSIEEAYRITRKYDIFVSESIMVGSAEDHTAAIIEKSPGSLSLFRSDTSFIICANHFQSKLFLSDPSNRNSIEESSSGYRFHRMRELLDGTEIISVPDAATLLRDQKGLQGAEIGMGNEKAVNQLIAHHSVIFKPLDKKVWLSTTPYNLGEYIAFDLDVVFGTDYPDPGGKSLSDTALTIPEDPFLHSREYSNFMLFKELRREIEKVIRTNGKGDWDRERTALLIGSNPDYYLVYSLAGDLHSVRREYGPAEEYFLLALEKVIPTQKEESQIREKLELCQRRMK